jgi:hypothetical protein
MALKVPNIGELTLLDLLTANWGTLDCGLFKSMHTPADGDTLATYTAIEADFPGYARQQIQNWLAASTDGTGRALSVADVVTFTRGAGGAPQNIYGYFVVDAAGNLLWAELDPNAPVAINNPGNTYSILPTLTLKTEN